MLTTKEIIFDNQAIFQWYFNNSSKKVLKQSEIYVNSDSFQRDKDKNNNKIVMW